MPSVVDRAGSVPSSHVVASAAALAREWAGGRVLAILAGGSHPVGEAVWWDRGDRALSLSDVDLWVVVPDEAAKRAALARARAAREGLTARLLEAGLAAPLDAGFHTPRDLAGLPARPAVIDLARSGRVIEGDATWLERVPRWTAADVPGEEIALLLENRGLELLHAWWGLRAEDPLERLRARHATLKSALDLAAVTTLARGELPPGIAARVAAARALLEHESAGGATGVSLARLAPLWEAALAWRRRPEPGDPAAARAEWQRVVQAWTSVWLDLSGRADPAAESDPYRRAVRWARRARLRRRLRQAAFFAGRAAAPPLSSRLARALHGTPQHRLNASATVLLLSAAQGPAGSPAIGPSAARALARLGVAGSARGWPDAARAVVRAWDAWVLDGQRTATWA